MRTIVAICILAQAAPWITAYTFVAWAKPAHVFQPRYSNSFKRVLRPMDFVQIVTHPAIFNLRCFSVLQVCKCLRAANPKLAPETKKNPCRVEASLPLFCCCCNELTMRKDKLGAGLNRDFVQDACRYIEACGMDCSSCSLRNSFSR